MEKEGIVEEDLLDRFVDYFGLFFLMDGVEKRWIRFIYLTLEMRVKA